MKVKFDISLEAWLQDIEVEAESYEEAETILRRMDLYELVDEGYIKDLSLVDVDGEVIERDVKVKVTDIDYDLDEDELEQYKDLLDNEEYFPKSFEFTFEDFSPDDADLEEAISDRITDETDFLINTFEYDIIEEK